MTIIFQQSRACIKRESWTHKGGSKCLHMYGESHWTIALFCILNHCLWFSLPHAAEQVVQVFAIFTNLSVPIDEWAVSSKVQSSSPFVIQDEHVQHQCSPYFVRLFSMESPAPLHCISLSHNYASSFLIAFKILSDETCFVCYIILAIYPLPLNAELSPYNFSILFLPNLCCITPSSR